jgi:hypothetical protein
VLLLGEVLAPLAPLLTSSSASPRAVGQYKARRKALLTSVREDEWLLQTPLWIYFKMPLPSSWGTHFLSTPEDAPHL